MPSIPDFLAAIYDRPSDEGLRLMFADFLEELGDPRGAWLRLPDHGWFPDHEGVLYWGRYKFDGPSIVVSPFSRVPEFITFPEWRCPNECQVGGPCDQQAWWPWDNVWYCDRHFPKTAYREERARAHAR